MGAQQSPSTICFDSDCVNDAAHPKPYRQGTQVRISVPGWPTLTQSWMSARCMEGCPAADPSAGRVYWVMYRGGEAVFPDSFIDAGPNNDGGNSLLDKAPRYNSTWEVTVHIATPVTRPFAVWLYDAWEDDFGNFTVRPGATHQLRAAGFEPNAEVVYRWERREAGTGRFLPFLSRTMKADSNGVLTTDFQFSKDESQRILACGGLTHDCYRLVMSGAGKEAETVNVQVGLARIQRGEASPRPEPGANPTLQRTMNATGVIDLYYPAGRLHTGPKFLPEDAPASVRHGGQALRVNVERWFTVNETVYLIDDVPLRYDPQSFVWRAVWTIPKEIPIENDGRYRLRLPEQRDMYGNVVVAQTLLNFSIDEASVRPVITEPIRELERTREGVMRLAVRYYNASPFTPAEAAEGNAGKLTGCFRRVPPPPPPPAPPTNTEVSTCAGMDADDLVTATYYDGAWNFTVKYTRGYENLDQHRFILNNGTRDKWGNIVLPVRSDPYTVVPARPEVELKTVMRGEESEVLERGNRITITAVIQYHDGTPYNHNVRVNPNSSAARELVGILTRRGPAVGGEGYGPIASEDNFTLRESDASRGHWTGYLQLTDDDTFTPAGIWTWKFDVVDNVSPTPNANVSAIDREVVSSLIRVCPTHQPAGSVPTGATLKFRFRLYYSDCDVGREVAPGALETQLTARVYRYSPQLVSPFGSPLSNAIIPSYSSQTGDWGIDYVVPNEIFTGTYAFLVTGADTYGNKIVPRSHSRPFSTYTDVLLREVVAHPQGEVQRGDSATVIFDAREGDTGVDPSIALPRIQLERFDTSTTDCANGVAEGGCWVRERADVRVPDETLEDHVGVFPVGTDTPVGLYRFSLQGRDRNFHIITGVSANFTVNPTLVTRSLLSLPPESVVKGQPFSFYLESLPGDQVRERVAFHNGRPISVPLPLMTHERGRVNATWSVPFEAPTGNYTLRFSGRDVNGNVITILTPPIDALAASLEGRIVGQPTRTIARGEAARLQFGVGYPDGSFYAAPDVPVVSVVSAAGFTQPATIRREGLSFAAVWSPTSESPIGEYYFQVSPQASGGTGNLFPPLRSEPFRVVPGTIVRDPINDLGQEVERLAAAVYTVPFAADDSFAGFELVYYGPSLSTAIDTTTPLAEVTRTPLPHTIDASTGKYVARLVTDHQTQTGTYKIEMIGEDAYGNTITSLSRPFIIRPTTIGVVYDPVPPNDAFGEGKTITLSFVATYRVGTIMDESYGTPSATLLWNGQPVTQRPELIYRDGHWFMSWTAPATLPSGEYQFVVGGSDVMGNPIATARSTPYVITDGSLLESANKVVPGPSPVLLVVALAAIAAIFARKRRA